MEVFLERLQKALDYNPDTGLFTWKESRFCGRYRSVLVVQAGDVAGCLRRDGYTSIGIDRKVYMAHRLAWLYSFGSYPDDGFEIDHIDGDRSNNRIKNLRLVTRNENLQNLRSAKSHNKTSGVLGVHFDSQRGKWRAVLNLNKKKHCLGFFNSVEEAAKARALGESRLFTHAPDRNIF